jgi:hypothetical protein
MDGSATFKISSDTTVMPNWHVASIKAACSIAHNAVFAERFPARAAGSI